MKVVSFIIDVNSMGELDYCELKDSVSPDLYRPEKFFKPWSGPGGYDEKLNEIRDRIKERLCACGIVQEEKVE